MTVLDFSKAQFIDVYNYHKFFLPQDLQRTIQKKTGKLLEISSVKNLVVIDIDNSKVGQEALSKKTYDKIKKILPRNIIAERTGNLGFHIYLYNDLNQTFSKNRFINLLKTKDYSFDIFLTSKQNTKQNRILVSGSKVKDKNNKIFTYKFIRHNFDYNKPVMTLTEFSDLLQQHLNINILQKLEKQQ